MVASYFGGITFPASSACNRSTRPCSRSTSAMYRTPGSFPAEGGFSPRLEGASSTVRCWCVSEPSEVVAELWCRTPAARARAEVLSNDLRVSDSILNPRRLARSWQLQPRIFLLRRHQHGQICVRVLPGFKQRLIRLLCVCLVSCHRIRPRQTESLSSGDRNRVHEIWGLFPGVVLRLHRIGLTPDRFRKPMQHQRVQFRRLMRGNAACVDIQRLGAQRPLRCTAN
jgi:hypothetical protein